MNVEEYSDRKSALRLLRGGAEGIERWNMWRAEVEGIEALPDMSHVDLSRTNLSRADLNGMYFAGANFTESKLYEAELFRSDFTDAKFIGANLFKANLSDAVLIDAILTGASLSGANLTGATLRGADFTDAKMVEAKLMHAHLGTAKLNSANLSNADLSHAFLNDVDLTNADLSHACCDNVTMRDAQLSGADLTKATLENATLRECNFSSATIASVNIRYATITDANFTDANLKNASLRDVNLGRCNFTNANLASAHINNADCSYADFTKANLNGAHLDNANCTMACFDNTDFTKAVISRSILASVDLSTAIGLDKTKHYGASTLGLDTFRQSNGNIADEFLRGCGLSPWELFIVRLYDPDSTAVEIAEIQNELFDRRVKGPLFLGGIFLSYSHNDSQFVDQLEKRLNKEGAVTWRDIHKAVSGPLEHQISEAIRLTDAVLLILSKSSIDSDWVEAELHRARKKEKECKRNVLCPVALDDSWKAKAENSVLWRQVTTKNILDFSRWKTESCEKSIRSCVAV
ncbi:MAG: pentapeptide repeat-containing protein [Planctomycetota bacterium]|nr:pentapeptide repeat-containing protein [Planctomycetota bacterium]